MKHLSLLLFALCSSQGMASVNYYEDIKPIVEENCQTCHSEGGVSFSFEKPEFTINFGPAMVNAVSERRMPPWLAAKGHREYEDDHSLSDEQISLFQAWADNSFAAGNSKKAKSGQKAEKADFEHQVSLSVNEGKPYLPRQDRKDDYRCFMMDWPSDTKQFVTGFEGLPKNKRVAHHLVVFSAKPEIIPILRELAAEEKGPGYQCFGGGFPDRIGKKKVADALEKKHPGIVQKINDGVQWLAHWAPGMDGYDFPNGTGIPVEPGSVVIAQMHYFSAFAPGESDQGSLMNFKVADKVKHAGFNLPLTRKEWLVSKKNKSMAIAPGEEKTYRVSTPIQLFVERAKGYLGPQSNGIETLELHSANLHMHEIGKSGRIYLEDKWGHMETLLEVPRWDLNWQRDFTFKKAIKISPEQFKTSKLVVECTFLNPKNVTVYGGFGSEEEMCFNFSYFVAKEKKTVARKKSGTKIQL